MRMKDYEAANGFMATLGQFLRHKDGGGTKAQFDTDYGVISVAKGDGEITLSFSDYVDEGLRAFPEPIPTPNPWADDDAA